MKNTAPSPFADPEKHEHFQENFGAVTDLFWQNRQESEEIGGQGQWVPDDRLTDAFKEHQKENQINQGLIIDNGFDYGDFHEDGGW